MKSMIISECVSGDHFAYTIRISIQQDKEKIISFSVRGRRHLVVSIPVGRKSISIGKEAVILVSFVIESL